MTGAIEKIPLSDENVEELFQRAGQRFGEGLHIDYWTKFYDANDPQRPKLELFLALQQQAVWEALEKSSLQLFNALLKQNRQAGQFRAREIQQAESSGQRPWTNRLGVAG